MKLRIKLEDEEVTATLVDSATTRDFVSLLPLTLTINDLFGREKYGNLPKALSEEVPGRIGTKSAISRTGLRITRLPSTTAKMVNRYVRRASIELAK